MSNHSCRLRSLLLAAILASAGVASAQQAPEASNMGLVGVNDLQGRSAYQPIIHQQGSRWIAYIGHHGGKALNPLTGVIEPNGTSVVDVTDPAQPRFIAHIPGEPGNGESGGAQMARLCSGKGLGKADPSHFYLLRTYGNSAHEIWDVTAPEKPVVVSRITGLRDTHKNFWECDTGIAYLVSGLPGWKTRRMIQVYDLGDPAHPRLIRNYGLPGQQPGAPDSMHGKDYEMHGPIRSGNRVYFGYNTFVNGVIQIVDRDKLLRGDPKAKDPFAPTDDSLRYPVVTTLYTSPRLGAHTTLPVLGMDVPEFARNAEGRKRDILVVVNESLKNECRENRQMMYVVDITTETRPWGVANFQVPEASGQFCSRGGRFGTHSSNESMTSMYHGKLVFLAYFNAGVRAVDIRNPWSPTEVAHYIPAITDKTDQRCVTVDGAERCKVAIQTNNVEVDDRGYIYAVDRANTGLHVLELTGAARAIAQP